MADSPPDDLSIMSVRMWDIKFSGARDRGWVIIIPKREKHQSIFRDSKSG